MSEKNVRLFIVGEGDAQLQSMIEKGLLELGRKCETTDVETGAAAVLDNLNDNEIPIVIKSA